MVGIHKQVLPAVVAELNSGGRSCGVSVRRPSSVGTKAATCMVERSHRHTPPLPPVTASVRPSALHDAALAPPSGLMVSTMESRSDRDVDVSGCMVALTSQTMALKSSEVVAR